MPWEVPQVETISQREEWQESRDMPLSDTPKRQGRSRAEPTLGSTLVQNQGLPKGSYKEDRWRMLNSIKALQI